MIPPSASRYTFHLRYKFMEKFSSLKLKLRGTARKKKSVWNIHMFRSNVKTRRQITICIFYQNKPHYFIPHPFLSPAGSLNGTAHRSTTGIYRFLWKTGPRQSKERRCEVINTKWKSPRARRRCFANVKRPTLVSSRSIIKSRELRRRKEQAWLRQSVFFAIQGQNWKKKHKYRCAYAFALPRLFNLYALFASKCQLKSALYALSIKSLQIINCVLLATWYSIPLKFHTFQQIGCSRGSPYDKWT